MFDDLDVKNCNIKLIKNYPCDSRKALEKEDGLFIQSSKQCYNKYVAGRTDKQYYIDNAEKIKEQKKKYYNDNLDKLKEQKKLYYLDNLDNFKKYTKDNADKLKQKINCECGGRHTYANISVHLKSIKHQKYLKIEL